MDPVTIIAQAMVLAVANLADPLIKDAYNGLKELIKRKFQEPTLNKAVDKLEQNPEGWQAALEDGLRENQAGEDAELLAAAQRLYDQLRQFTGNTGGDTFTGNNAQKNIHSGKGDIVTGRKVDTGGGNYTETNIGNINADNVTFS